MVCHSNFIRYFVRHFRREGEFGSGDRDHDESDEEGEGAGGEGKSQGGSDARMSTSDPLLDQLSEFKVGAGGGGGGGRSRRPPTHPHTHASQIDNCGVVALDLNFGRQQQQQQPTTPVEAGQWEPAAGPAPKPQPMLCVDNAQLLFGTRLLDPR